MASYILNKEQIDEFLFHAPARYCQQQVRARPMRCLCILYGIRALYTSIQKRQGKKMELLCQNDQAHFLVYEMDHIIKDERKPYACNVNTAYQSVCLSGRAAAVEDIEEKEKALLAFLKKYAPSFLSKPMPRKSVEATGIVKIIPDTVSGKGNG